MTYNKYMPYLPSFIIVCVALVFQSCTDKCEQVAVWDQYTPIYMDYEEMRVPVASEAARALENPGKIYFKSPYLFINEVSEGIHVIDNSDKLNPNPVAFIAIKGNVDLAIKGSILYADSYMDLLAIDISDIHDAKIVERVENVFDDNFPYWEGVGVLAGYDIERKEEILDCDANVPNSGGWGGGSIIMDDLAFAESGTSGNSNNAPSSGVGGSMARFTVYGDHLYAVTETHLQSFSLSNPQKPESTSDIHVTWGLETIFPFEGHLLLGSRVGMFIYSVKNEGYPLKVSEVRHWAACDPVVAEGDYAYVTLRAGRQCDGSNLNQLDVIDISDIANPKLLISHPMTNPHGLGIDKGTLFLCDGDDGLKVFDTKDPYKIHRNKIDHFKDINAFDVIPYNNNLMMIGSDGFYQYNYRNRDGIEFLSKIGF